MLNKSLDITKKIIKRTKIQLDELKDFNFKSKFFRFSIIIILDNSSVNVNDSIKNIVNQTIGFEDNVSLIIIDINDEKQKSEICQEYVQKFPENIFYIHKPNNSISNAKNLAIELSNSKYLNFLNAGDEFDLDSLEKINSFFKKYYYDVDVISLPIKCLGDEFDENILNEKYDSIRILNLDRESNFIQYDFSPVFFKKEVIESFGFENDNRFDDYLFLNKVLLEKRKIGLISDTYCSCRTFDKLKTPFDQNMDSTRYYLQFQESYIENLFVYSQSKFGEVKDFIKNDALFEIGKILDTIDNPKKLENNTLDAAKSIIYKTLQDIDDEIIINHRNMDNSLKYTLLLFKHGALETTIGHDSNNVVKRINGFAIDQLNYHIIYIDYVEIYQNTLYLGGFLKSFFTAPEIKIQVLKNCNGKTEIYDCNHIDYPQRDRTYLDLCYNPSLNFEFKIPLHHDEESEIKIMTLYEDQTYELALFFNGYVKLSPESFYSKKEDYIIKFENNRFYIEDYELNKLLSLEKENIQYLKSKNDSELDEAIDFRNDYYESYESFQNRKIWLFMDRIDAADDNAEYLFKYCMKQQDNIEKYFVISKDSKDYGRLKEIGNVVDYGSREHMLLCCFAEKIICSHPDDEFINPFYYKTEKYYSGLLSAKVCFLQHGIILNNISSWLHKYDKFLYLIVTSAKEEYSSLFNYAYNYDKSLVEILGLPRFDGLENSEKNQIVFMPTWRRYIENMTEEQIKNSQYYKSINSLLSNENLVNFLNDNGYTLIFKPHPNLKEYLHLFNFNSTIKVDFESSYHDIFNSSKLLITDYSSVTFDFAYLKKPVIYYQFDNENFHFDLSESYFNFEKMGFGEVTNDEDELIELINEYILNNCELNEKYEKRIGEFFEFNDKNNCKRVYERIIKI